MSDSSQLPLYSITLNDTMASTTVDTITLTSGSTSFYSGSAGYINTVSISPTMSVGSISIPDIQTSFVFPTEWVDSFPEWHRVEDMCKKYPGLKIAFENFKTFYCMVKDDYDNPKDET